MKTKILALEQQEKFSSSPSLRTRTPCKFFAEGTCIKGTKCKYLHANTLAATTVGICRYWMQNDCGRGCNCRFMHPPRNIQKDAAAATAAAAAAPLRKKLFQGRNFHVTSPPPIAVSLSSPALTSFQSSEDEQQHYFFGAAGDFTTTTTPSRQQLKELRKKPALNYSKIVKELSMVSQPSPPRSLTKNTRTPPCKFFALGYCRHGVSCALSHDNNVDANVVAVVVSSQNKTCGICFDLVLPKRFGLLMNCDCVYCLACVRSWRSNQDGSLATENVRRCPLCRVPSYFIIPCNRHPTGSNKQQVVAEYLKSLKHTPCDHFSANQGNCPFGTSCFYSHVRQDGTVDTTVPRLKKDGKGELSNFETHTLSDFIYGTTQ